MGGRLSLFGARSDLGRTSALRSIKDATRALLDAREDDVVVVTELTCSEPGCPPVETVIVLLREGRPTRQVKLHRSAVEVTSEHIAEAFAATEDHDHESDHRPL
jgi:hypothetical protein